MKNVDTNKFAFRKTTVTVFVKPTAGAAKEAGSVLDTSSGCYTATSIWTSSIIQTLDTLFG